MLLGDFLLLDDFLLLGEFLLLGDFLLLAVLGGVLPPQMVSSQEILKEMRDWVLNFSSEPLLLEVPAFGLGRWAIFLYS